MFIQKRYKSYMKKKLLLLKIITSVSANPKSNIPIIILVYLNLVVNSSLKKINNTVYIYT